MRARSLTPVTSRRLLGRIAGLCAAGAAGLAGGAAIAARLISGPNRPSLDYRFTPFEVGAPSEDVSFASGDGTQLAGWWLDHPESDRVVVACHGHRGNKSDMLGIGPGLWRADNTVFMFDFRGNGDSADGPQSLAHYERQDLRAAIDLVKHRRPEARVAVLGFSMGAAVTILEAAADERIEALVLDSPFADMHGVIATAIRRFRVPPFLLTRLTDLATKMRYGYRFADVQPIDVIGSIPPRPILLLHGDADRIIPLNHGERLAEAAGVELVRFPGSDHCGGYFDDRPGYIAHVAEWLARELPAKESSIRDNRSNASTTSGE